MGANPDIVVDQAPVIAEPMQPRLFRIRTVRSETHDTFTLELEQAEGTPDSSFKAGQFNMLYVYGVGEVPVSISGNPTTPGILVHTIRSVGTVTKAIHKLKRDDFLGVRGPFGSHWPVDESAGSDIVIVAGGIGLAPLRPALYHVLSQREKYGKVVLLYGTRTPDDILYRRELERWRSRFDLDVHITVDRAPSGWRGNVGVVTLLISKAPFDPLNTVAMVCGPEVMMRFAVQELHKHGIGGGDIYVSMERNMKCAVGFCGHCQYGPVFICKDGPVFPYDRIKDLFALREI
jgi:NAD(P)H-flavin reductase